MGLLWGKNEVSTLGLGLKAFIIYFDLGKSVFNGNNCHLGSTGRLALAVWCTNRR